MRRKFYPVCVESEDLELGSRKRRRDCVEMALRAKKRVVTGFLEERGKREGKKREKGRGALCFAATEEGKENGKRLTCADRFLCLFLSLFWFCSCFELRVSFGAHLQVCLLKTANPSQHLSGNVLNSHHDWASKQHPFRAFHFYRRIYLDPSSFCTPISIRGGIRHLSTSVEPRVSDGKDFERIYVLGIGVDSLIAEKIDRDENFGVDV